MYGNEWGRFTYRMLHVIIVEVPFPPVGPAAAAAAGRAHKQCSTCFEMMEWAEEEELRRGRRGAARLHLLNRTFSICLSRCVCNVNALSFICPQTNGLWSAAAALLLLLYHLLHVWWARLCWIQEIRLGDPESSCRFKDLRSVKCIFSKGICM